MSVTNKHPSNRTEEDMGLQADLRLVTRCSMPPLMETAATSVDCASLLKSAIAAKRGNRVHEYEEAMRALTDYFATKTPARTPAEVRRDFALAVGAAVVVPDDLLFLDYEAVGESMNAPVDLTQNTLNPSPKKREQ
jgi:hypothetical protein